MTLLLPFLQLRNHNRVKAPTAERAASLLDAAVAARRHNDFVTYLSHSSIMFFTLHVQPPRTESSTIGKGCNELFNHEGGSTPPGEFPPELFYTVDPKFTAIQFLSCELFVLRLHSPLLSDVLPSVGSRGPTKLTLIDVCSGIRGMSRNKPPYSELGSVVVSLLSGQKTTPSK